MAAAAVLVRVAVSHAVVVDGEANAVEFTAVEALQQSREVIIGERVGEEVEIDGEAPVAAKDELSQCCAAPLNAIRAAMESSCRKERAYVRTISCTAISKSTPDWCAYWRTNRPSITARVPLAQRHLEGR